MFKELGKEIQRRNYRLTIHPEEKLRYLEVKVDVEVHQMESGCFVADYGFEYERRIIKGGPLIMNGPGESKLVKKLRKHIASMINFENSKKRF